MESIREYRIRHLMTQKEFADLAGVSENTIRKLETGKASIGEMKVKTAALIAEAIGITLDELYDDELFSRPIEWYRKPSGLTLDGGLKPFADDEVGE